MLKEIDSEVIHAQSSVFTDVVAVHAASFVKRLVVLIHFSKEILNLSAS